MKRKILVEIETSEDGKSCGDCHWIGYSGDDYSLCTLDGYRFRHCERSPACLAAEKEVATADDNHTKRIRND